MTSRASLSATEVSVRLAVGVALRRLPCESDRCGALIGLYRRDRQADIDMVQWNMSASRAGTLRGVHVHPTHSDYFCLVSGEMLLGLHDMRPWSPTYRLATRHQLRGEEPCSVVIPPGVAHGFYYSSDAIHIYAVSHYWNPADELGCRWNEAELGLSWPTTEPLLSARDAGAPSYSELAHALAMQHGYRSYP